MTSNHTSLISNQYIYNKSEVNPFEDNVLDTVKLLSISKEERELILSLLASYSKSDNSDYKNFILNSLECYNIYTTKAGLERKIKLSSILP